MGKVVTVLRVIAFVAAFLAGLLSQYCMGGKKKPELQMTHPKCTAMYYYTPGEFGRQQSTYDYHKIILTDEERKTFSFPNPDTTVILTEKVDCISPVGRGR